MGNYKIILLFILLPLLIAMGSSPSYSPTEIPIPAKKFQANFIDLMDVVTECREVSIEGKTFLAGKRGNGTIAIPFENIREITLLSQGEKLNALVKLKDGHTIEVTLERNLSVYGRTKYGNFQIKLGELKKVTFIH